ncbi:MAG: 2-C-methyl-D-erythritol 4-phosphate cytidylyltransferase [Candidatus Omnitrophica bacterium]|nr:2-C-methyl-D-erythritol 4-phosphate cytidylyltransferase [Candidatus Omnitrophota bacterium]
MYLTAVVPAAGKGKRVGCQLNKPFFLLEGKPLLAYSLLTLEESSLVNDIILVVEESKILEARRLVRKYRISKVKEIVAGGKSRQDSVASGLRRIGPLCELVLIHDGARPFLTEELIRRTTLAAKRYKAAAPGFPISDTIKEVRSSSFIKSTIKNRESFWAVQTPQAFRAKIIQKAYFRAKKDHFLGTDSASLVEGIGVPVRIIKGDPYNIKITTKNDLLLAKALLKIKGSGLNI